jgi:hypothetical protein
MHHLSQTTGDELLWTVVLAPDRTNILLANARDPLGSAGPEDARCYDERLVSYLSSRSYKLRGCLVYEGHIHQIIESNEDDLALWSRLPEGTAYEGMAVLGALRVAPDTATRFVPFVVGPVTETWIGPRVEVVDLRERRTHLRRSVGAETSLFRVGHRWFVDDHNPRTVLTVLDGDTGVASKIELLDVGVVRPAAVAGGLVWVFSTVPIRGELGVERLRADDLGMVGNWNTIRIQRPEGE